MYGYAQRTGDLFLFRPCALGRHASDIVEGKARKLPVEFEYTRSESDVIDISVPPGLTPAEVPKTVKQEYPFATYTSEVTTSSNSVRYTRTIVISDIAIGVEQLSQLKAFFRQISKDEQSYTILQGALANASRSAKSEAAK